MKDFTYYAGADLSYPARPVKPRMPARGEETAAAFATYAQDLELYEDAMLAYRENTDNHRRMLRSRIDKCVYDLAVKYSISTEQAGLIWGRAWEDRHSEGFAAVIDEFEELFTLMEKYVKLSINTK